MTNAYQDINEYMMKSRDERRQHLDLSEDCIFAGGLDSREFRGLLAHTLKTTIPKGRNLFYATRAISTCVQIQNISIGKLVAITFKIKSRMELGRA